MVKTANHFITTYLYLSQIDTTYLNIPVFIFLHMTLNLNLKKFGITSFSFSDENVRARGRQINHLSKGHTQVTWSGFEPAIFQSHSSDPTSEQQTIVKIIKYNKV